MIVLWLLVAHLIGDYLLQTRWQANGKFGWTAGAIDLRLKHAFFYCAPFVPVALAYGSSWKPHYGFYPNVIAFLLLLFVAHFFTDAQRFTRTPGEWIAYKLMNRKAQIRAVFGFDAKDRGGVLVFPPNPWPTIGLAIDQTLHMIQIAVLATIFLT